MPRPRVWLCGLFLLSSLAGCSGGSGSSDASGIAGAGGSGAAGSGGRGGQAGASVGAAGGGGSGGSAGGGGAGSGGRGGQGGIAGQTGGAGGRGGQGGTGGDACAAIAGKTFSSVDEHECGRGPDGGFFCHWRLTFTTTGFTWQHSDYAEAGTYTCSANTVTGQRPTGSPITGQYDAASQTLTWDGIAYLPQ